VRAQSLGAAPDADSQDWWKLPDDTARVVTGNLTTVQRSPAVEGMVERARELDRAVISCGWPTLALPDQSGRPRVVPLFGVELRLPGRTASWTELQVSGPAELDPALLAASLLSPDVVDHLRELVPTSLQGLSPARWDALLTSVLELLRLDWSDGLSSSTRSARAVQRSVAIVREASAATRTLEQDLRELSKRRDVLETALRPLAAVVLGHGAAGPETDGPPDADVAPGRPTQAVDHPPIVPGGLQLSASQEAAVADALRSELTVVTGPPGTGKSEMVVDLVANQFLRGHSVLVASTNNAAVDVAVERAETLDPLLLLRTGNQKVLEKLPALLDVALSTPRPDPASPGVVGARLAAAGRDRAAILEELSQRTVLEGALAQSVVDLLELEGTLWTAGHPPQHVESARWVRRLGSETRPPAPPSWAWWSRWRESRLLRRAGVDRPGVGGALVRGWAQAHTRRDDLHVRLESLPPADSEREAAEVLRVDEEWSQVSLRGLLAAVHHAVRQESVTAVEQVRTLRLGGTPARQAAMGKALGTARAWACTAQSVRPSFALQSALFDAVIVDEASQCTIATVLPTAYRAKQIVIVGDPNQLTPVVSLGPRTLSSIARAHGTTEEALAANHLSAGSDSAFTAFAALLPPGHEHFLAEHYRCHPAIARYLNDEFYGGRLDVLSDVSAAVAQGLRRGFEVLDVAGRTERPPGGSAVNHAEVEAVVQWVRERSGEPGTLGVLTPFAPQAELLRSRLRTAFPPETHEELWEERKLVVGAVHSLQGDQRDVVLFSTVLTRGADERSTRWLQENPQVVNVAVSRARRLLVLVGHAASLRELPVDSLRALHEAATREHTTLHLSERDLREDRHLHSRAEQVLFSALLERGVALERKPLVEGYELDFAWRGEGRQLDVEVDGTQHTDALGRQRRSDLRRDAILREIGWQVLRFPAHRCLRDPDAVAEEVVRAIHS